MIRQTFIIILALVLYAFCNSTVKDTAAVPPSGDTLATVTGYLEDSETGKGIEISVMNPAGDYDNYSVLEKGKGRDLKKQVGQLVKLYGNIQADGKKIKTFFVEKYEILKNSPADSTSFQ
jgi:hypothetical protein